MMIAAPTSATGWTFLVARGRHTDYRTVLAPDFLVDARGHGILSYWVTKADARPGETRTIEVRARDGERLFVHYKNEAMSDRSLLDEHGRPLEVAYGVVTRRPVHVTDQALARARDEALESYRHFLEHEDDRDVARSDGFPLGAPVEVEPDRAEPDRPVVRRPPHNASAPSRRPVGLIAGGAAALLALAAIGIVLATSSGSNPGLEVRALGCTPPAASITRHGAQTANYQFDSATGAVLQKGPVRFNGADTQQVSLPTKVPGRFTLRVTGSGQSQTVPFRC